MICMCYRLRVPDVAAQDLVSIGQPSLSCCGDCWNYSNWALFYLRLQCARLCNNMVASPNNVYIQSLTTLSGRLRIQIKLKQNILLGTLFFSSILSLPERKGRSGNGGMVVNLKWFYVDFELVWFALISNWVRIELEIDLSLNLNQFSFKLTYLSRTQFDLKVNSNYITCKWAEIIETEWELAPRLEIEIES